MSNARKLQTEIDRVMKKVDEGVELFDEIWEKVYSAEQQNQKEKYEMDLKKEIKKLQRLRDQIKSWIGSSDVKDKEPLLDARKLIETKMEQFKICEKETKTKTYSKEGLARQEKLDPAEQAKRDTTNWMGEVVEQLTKIVDDQEVEIERLSSGKGKKTNKNLIEDFNHFIAQHKYHISKLEGVIRLVNNDVLDVEIVDPLKEDLDYYLESYEDEDYQQAYDEEFFYEALGLDDLDVVNVDRVTQAAQPAVLKEADNASSSTKGSKGEKKSKKSVSSVIPLTIGRARVSGKSKSKKDSGSGNISSNDEDGDNKTPKKREPTPTTIPAARPTPSVAPPGAAAGGASMAAILKRETEQQEKERQKARQAEQLRQQQQQAAAAQQQQLQRQQQEAQIRQQQEALRQQQQRQEAAAKQKAIQQQQQQEALRQQQQQQAQQEALKRQQAAQQQQAQQAGQAGDIPGPQLQGQGSQGSSGAGSSGVAGLEILAGLGGLSLDGPVVTPGAAGDGSTYLSALNEAFATMPNASDNERSRQYAPQNPYPTPNSYPTSPSPIFDNPQIFEKLGMDALFFIFYYAQGTYQQYLAARELKKQSWRFHKKYMTWFQRHEEPKVTTDEYEQGTYVYFDYETGWCTRIKQDFRFEYSFLEDSLQ